MEAKAFPKTLINWEVVFQKRGFKKVGMTWHLPCNQVHRKGFGKLKHVFSLRDEKCMKGLWCWKQGRINSSVPRSLRLDYFEARKGHKSSTNEYKRPRQESIASISINISCLQQKPGKTTKISCQLFFSCCSLFNQLKVSIFLKPGTGRQVGPYGGGGT